MQTKRGLISGRKAVLLLILAGLAGVAVVISVVLFFGKRQSVKVRDAYIEYIGELDYPEGYTDYPYLDYLRFEFGYVDDNDIPELFICHGNGHADHVIVCRYDAESATVKQIGEYSSFGQLWYYERQAVVGGQYGGMGFWYDVYESVNDTDPQQVLAISASFSEAEDAQEHYYWASPYLGTVSDAHNFNGFENYVVSEEEWKTKSGDLLSTLGNKTQVTFEKMLPYSKKAAQTEWDKIIRKR